MQYRGQDISLTTVQGVLSAAAVGLTNIAGGMAIAGHVKTGLVCGALAIICGGVKAGVAFFQNDATKPLDSQGKPVPSSEVPVDPSKVVAK